MSNERPSSPPTRPTPPAEEACLCCDDSLSGCAGDSALPSSPVNFVSDQLYPEPSCTLCGAAMALKCLSCESTPELTPVPSSPERTPAADEQILKERDEAEEWADRLAYAIGSHFGVSVGEHSNCNDPRVEALKILSGEYVTLESLREALCVHWLSEIVCNHEAKTDVSRCACGQFESKPQPSVGEAVKRHVEHVYRSVGFAAPAAGQEATPDANDLLLEIEKWCTGENQVDDGEDAEDALRHIQDAIRAFFAGRASVAQREETQI